MNCLIDIRTTQIYTKEKYPYLSDSELATLEAGKLGKANRKDLEPIYKKMQIVSDVLNIRYQGGINAKQYIDGYMQQGFNKVNCVKIGAVNHWQLVNEAENRALPIGKKERTYIEMMLKENH